MNFIDNILQIFGENIILKEPSYKIIVFGEQAVYIEGIKSVKYYEKEEICLEIKKGEILIKGKDLYIKKYCAGDIAICGKIVELKRK